MNVTAAATLAGSAWVHMATCSTVGWATIVTNSSKGGIGHVFNVVSYKYLSGQILEM